jgi:opacity protein-like surface antigen
MKKTLAVVSASLLATPVLANDVQYFVGGGLGGQYISVSEGNSYEGEYDNYAYSSDSSSEQTAFGSSIHIRTGMIFSQNHRVTLTANFTGDTEISSYSSSYSDGEWSTGKDEIKQTELLLSYDYIHALNNNVSIFGGATVGTISNELSRSDKGYDPYYDEEWSESNSLKGSDFGYGLQIGAQYKINENWSADLTYRHMFSTLDKSTTLIESDRWTETSTGKVNNHGVFTVTVDYRF